MTRNRKILTGVGLSVIVLAACDGSDGEIGNPSLQFGEVFSTAFNADANDVPAEDLQISFLGVDGVDLTADPIDF